MKLRWYVVETDYGPSYMKPAWPKSMSLGKPHQQFHHTQPRLQYKDKGKSMWTDVPTVVRKVKSDRVKEYENRQKNRSIEFMEASK